MKKKLIAVILVCLMFTIFISCNSCTTGNAQPIKTLNEYKNDTINNDTALYRMIISGNPINITDQDTTEILIIKRVIEPVEVDTTWKSRRDAVYEQLDKTENDLKIQHKTIDSMIVVKKR